MDVMGIAAVGHFGKAIGEGRPADDPVKIRDAAKQFESLLIAQILRSVREAEGTWLGQGRDSAGDCATELAEQQLAAALSSAGGLHLGDLIASGLKRGT